MTPEQDLPAQGDPADEHIEVPDKHLPHGIEAASFWPPMLRAIAGAQNELFHEPVPVKSWVLLTLLDSLEAARDFAKAAQALYEEVQMAEATGVCLPDRVACLRLGETLARHPGFLPTLTGENE